MLGMSLYFGNLVMGRKVNRSKIELMVTDKKLKIIYKWEGCLECVVLLNE